MVKITIDHVILLTQKIVKDRYPESEYQKLFDALADALREDGSPLWIEAQEVLREHPDLASANDKAHIITSCWHEEYSKKRELWVPCPQYAEMDGNRLNTMSSMFLPLSFSKKNGEWADNWGAFPKSGKVLSAVTSLCSWLEDYTECHKATADVVRGCNNTETLKSRLPEATKSIEEYEAMNDHEPVPLPHDEVVRLAQEGLARIGGAR